MFIFYDVTIDCVIPYPKTCQSPNSLLKNISKIEFSISTNNYIPVYELLKTKTSIIANIKISLIDLPLILILSIGSIFFLFLICLHYCSYVNFVSFNTDLTIYKKKTATSLNISCILKYLYLFILGMLLCRCGIEQILLLINHFNPKFCENIFSLLLKYARVTHKVISVFLLLFSVSLSVTARCCFVCLFMFHVWC